MHCPASLRAASEAHISIAAGIVIGLLASFVQSLGLTIQRKSHVQNSDLPVSQQRAEYKRPLWLLGFAVFISSNVIGSLVQIASLPVVILAPLGAVSLLWNALLARFLLGDVFSPWMILGTILIAGGAVLIAVFGIVPEPTRSLEDLLQLFSRPTFVAYFSVLGALVGICLVITHIVDFSFSRRLAQLAKDHTPLDSPPMSPRASSVPALHQPSALTTGPTEAGLTATEATPLLDRKLANTSPSPSRGAYNSPGVVRTRIMLSISYASFSGIISGMCLLFAKSGVELLLLTVRGDNQFWRWQAWVLVLALVVFALLQLWYMHKALILADPTIVCPSAFCFYNLSSIVNGLVYFDQFGLISPLHLGLVGLGIAVLLGGVWVVSFQAGGRGVDIGAWVQESESDAGSIREELVAQQEEILSRETGPPQSHDRRRLTQSESHVQQLEPPLPSPATSPRRPHTLAAPPSPTIGLDSSLVSSPPRRRRRNTQQFHESMNLSPPSIGPGGFSIGLSPLSPGFALVPRNRRITSGATAFADAVEDVMDVRSRRRRTYSEGDAGSPSLFGSEGVDGSRSPPLRDGDRDRETGDTRQTKGRWKWLRRAFKL